MGCGTEIVAVKARQVFSRRGHPGIEATVATANGATGIAVVTAGISVGEHEVKFAYDGGTRWRGLGVQVAVDNVHKAIGPAIIGMDATKQSVVDDVIIKLDGTPDKSKLGGNATGCVSAAVLKAGAASLGIPLYHHIGGVNACILPVPGVGGYIGSRRYGGGARSGGKPSCSLMCYGFSSFAEASYGGWDVWTEWRQAVDRRFNVFVHGGDFAIVGPGVVKDDRELWDAMAQCIHARGYDGKIGIQIDVAATTYWDKQKQRFVGLFSPGDKTRDDLMRWYEEMVKDYPFVIIEDPLEENDYDGHALLTKKLGIEIVGDDLFTTNLERVSYGIERGAANAILLKVNQIGTITESFEMVQYAYQHGYGVMPCESRGEGEAIADYTVGLGTGHLRESAMGDTGNRFLEIEAELGPRAKFLGRKALKP